MSVLVDDDVNYSIMDTDLGPVMGNDISII